MSEVPVVDDYKFGFHDDAKIIYSTGKGLTEEIVREISESKEEPEWMLDFRLKSLEAYHKSTLPNWGPDLSHLKFDEITYFQKATDKVARTWEDVPDEIKETFEKIGIPEAERAYLAGVTVQYESEAVYHNMKDEFEKLGIIFTDTDTALKEYPEIFKEYFASIVPPTDNFEAALNSAVWSGGTFIYVPKGVICDVPLQTYFRINNEGSGQFERTLIVVDEGASVHYVEGCTAPTYSADSLHCAVVEILVKKDAYCRYTTIQNWSGNVYNLGDETCCSLGKRDDGMDRRQLGVKSDHEIPERHPERTRRQRNDAFRSFRRQRPTAGYRRKNDPQRTVHVQLDRLQVDRQRRRGSELPRTSEVRQEIGRIDFAYRMRHDHHGRHLHFRHDSVQRNPQRQMSPWSTKRKFPKSPKSNCTT